MNARASPPRREPAIVRSIRIARSWHRRFGVALAALVLLSAGTGLVLAYKKQSGWLQPPTARGVGADLAEWQTLDALETAAVRAFRQNEGAAADAAIDRMDVRPSRGVVKVRFAHDDFEVQLDGATGEVLSVGRRRADWVERLHDGSIVSEGFKLASMSGLGVGLLVLTASGLWLYLGPRRYRARRGRGRRP